MNRQLFKNHWWKFLLAILFIGVGILIFKNQSVQPTDRASSLVDKAPAKVSWHLEKGNVWMASGEPPACPEPLVLATPFDLSLVTAVLYPGQPRGDEYKPHGGFRFDNQPNNKIVVTAPFDAEVIRGSRLILNGEYQYAFEFVAPCGILYWFGHLLELSPKFQAIINNLPPNDERSTYATLPTPVSIKSGEVIATAVGYAKTNNVFVDWGVLDLRRKNGFKIRPEWQIKHGAQFDEYAICWLDLLSLKDSARAKVLPGGDRESGKMSDYCN